MSWNKEELVKEASAQELQATILANGLLTSEPLFVVAKDIFTAKLAKTTGLTANVENMAIKSLKEAELFLKAYQEYVTKDDV